MTNSSFSATIHLLNAAARLEERFAGELGAVHGLALKEALLLMHLERATKQRLSRVELAKRLSTSPSTVTRLTLPLEKLGLVGREADPRDARLAYVVLTEAGRRVVTDARTTLQRLSSDAFADRWAEEEITSLSGLLGRMAADQAGNLI
ncbi:MarR family winged helix-turn-helix transcriptional regulator [Microvirga flavescens]|uniref:MarR family winged helix-turn-helix transcriptional regulator n=1 Tax=Microvirga flavescens TaxID=2249811 RepID=UPI000DD8CEE5|nr:MarR family transcriptional regulator [Microvirga flavescens]